MSSDLSTLVMGAFAALVVTYFVLRTIGIARRAYKLNHSKPAPVTDAEHVLWRDPGAIERLDLGSGPGGRGYQPVPPYRFIEEHADGSQPCVSVRDARGRRWRIKWGHEVQNEAFAVRLAWACGYFSEVTYFVPAGRVEDAGPLSRASKCLDASGQFASARFELEDPAVDKRFGADSWSWTDNPFVGTHELAGLKVLLMLLSNWDNKDQRDAARGSNTAIFLTPVSSGRREARYLIVDWGGSMGRWGQTAITRGRWDTEGFAAQTPQFVTGLADGRVQFGYTGQRTADARDDIMAADVAWLCRSLGRVSDAQIRDALVASGATDAEIVSFTASLRARIEQLMEIAGREPVSPAALTPQLRKAQRPMNHQATELPRLAR